MCVGADARREKHGLSNGVCGPVLLALGGEVEARVVCAPLVFGWRDYRVGNEPGFPFYLRMWLYGMAFVEPCLTCITLFPRAVRVSSTACSHFWISYLCGEKFLFVCVAVRVGSLYFNLFLYFSSLALLYDLHLCPK